MNEEFDFLFHNHGNLSIIHRDGLYKYNPYKKKGERK